jgi:hypothetical protein
MVPNLPLKILKKSLINSLDIDFLQTKLITLMRYLEKVSLNYL